jgi:hypothetical protein
MVLRRLRNYDFIYVESLRSKEDGHLKAAALGRHAPARNGRAQLRRCSSE